MLFLVAFPDDLEGKEFPAPVDLGVEQRFEAAVVADLLDRQEGTAVFQEVADVLPGHFREEPGDVEVDSFPAIFLQEGEDGLSEIGERIPGGLEDLPGEVVLAVDDGEPVRTDPFADLVDRPAFGEVELFRQKRIRGELLDGEQFEAGPVPGKFEHFLEFVFDVNPVRRGQDLVVDDGAFLLDPDDVAFLFHDLEDVPEGGPADVQEPGEFLFLRKGLPLPEIALPHHGQEFSEDQVRVSGVLRGFHGDLRFVLRC